MVSATTSPFEVLRRCRVIAVVGASTNPEKDSNTIPKYLKLHGYRIIPINPRSEQVLGEKSYPSLLDLPPEIATQIDVVNVFRPSEELPEIAQQVVEMKKRYGRFFVFWSQLGLENDEAKGILTQNEILYVMDACMRATHMSSETSH